MSSKLNPDSKLPMMGQEDFIPLWTEDPAGSSDMSYLQGPFQTIGFVLDKVNVTGTCFLLQGKLGRISPDFLEQVITVRSERDFVAVGGTEDFWKRSFFRITR